MLAKAGESVQLALKYWNKARSWNYLLTTANGIAVVAPFTVASCTLTNGLTTLTNASNFTTVRQYDVVTGSGIANETVITTADPTTTTSLTMSYAATSPVSPATVTFARRDYALPTGDGADVNRIYTVRLVGTNPRRLHPLDLREHDTIEDDHTTPDVPTHYSLFTVSGEGRIRLIPTPSTADVLVIKYYRRMAVPVQDATVLDIPADYDQDIIALAKAFFTADKGSDAYKNSFWWKVGNDALRRAMQDDDMQPDEDVYFRPAGTVMPSVNSVAYGLMMDA